jgi:hypothetical protein
MVDSFGPGDVWRLQPNAVFQAIQAGRTLVRPLRTIEDRDVVRKTQSSMARKQVRAHRVEIMTEIVEIKTEV